MAARFLCLYYLTGYLTLSLGSNYGMGWLGWVADGWRMGGLYIG